MLNAATKTGNEHLLFVGDTITIGVPERAHVGWVNEIEGIADNVTTAGAVDIGHEVHELVGLAVAIGVGAADDATHVLEFAERAVLVGGDVDVAVGSHGDGGGVVGVEGLGEGFDFEAFRNREGGGCGSEEEQGLAFHSDLAEEEAE